MDTIARRMRGERGFFPPWDRPCFLQNSAPMRHRTMSSPCVRKTLPLMTGRSVRKIGPTARFGRRPEATILVAALFRFATVQRNSFPMTWNCLFGTRWPPSRVMKSSNSHEWHLMPGVDGFWGLHDCRAFARGRCANPEPTDHRRADPRPQADFSTPFRASHRGVPKRCPLSRCSFGFGQMGVSCPHGTGSLGGVIKSRCHCGYHAAGYLTPSRRVERLLP